MQRLPLVSPLDRALFLKAQPYLEGVESNVLAVVASYSEEREYARGAWIRKAGEPVDRVCFLGSGRVEVVHTIDDSPWARTIEAPGAIGMAHHFGKIPETPAVQALDRTICIEVETPDFTQIMEDHFSLLLQMARATADHILLSIRDSGTRRVAEEGFAEADRTETPAQLDLVQRLGRAKRMPFFRGVNLTVLGELIRFDPPRRVPAGEVLWKAGDPIDCMVLVLDGRFESQGAFGSSVAPAGSTLGAWEILLNGPRIEGWVATEASRVLTIHREFFIDVLEDHFEFALGYLAQVSRRLIEELEHPHRLGTGGDGS